MKNKPVKFSKDLSDFHRMSEDFANLWNDTDFVDFEIKVENEVIPCHKIIVAAQSPVLRRMMKTDMQERRENCVTLNNLSAPAIRKILEYLYTGNFSCPPSLLLDVVKACDYLEIITLRDLCRGKVISTLTPDNVIGWFRLATLLDMKEIIRACKRIICSTFCKVVQSAEFLSLTYTEINYVITLATSRKLSSDDLARAVFCWIKANLIEREEHCEELMELIELEKCSDAFISLVVNNFREIFKINSSFFKVYFDCMAGIGNAAASQSYENLSLILVGEEKVWKQNEKNEFEELTSFPDDLYDTKWYMWYSVCQYGDIGIVITGGEDDACQRTCMMFNLDEQKWKAMKKMKTPRATHASVCVNGVLMVIGGWTHIFKWSRSVEQLSLEHKNDEEEDWKAGPNLPKFVKYPKVAKLNTDVFVIDQKGRLLQLDTNKAEWKQKPTCPVQIASKYHNCWEYSVAAGNGKVYVGGGTNLVSCEYTVETESWVIAQWPRKLHYNGTLVFNKYDKLLLLGGWWGDKVEEYDTHEVEEYDTNEDVWKTRDYNFPIDMVKVPAFAVDMLE